MRLRLATTSPKLFTMRLESSLFVVCALAIAIGLPLALLPLSWAGAALALSTLVAALLQRPTWGLYLVILFVPFGSLLEFPFGVVSIGLAELALLATVAAWVARMLSQKEIYLSRLPLVVPLLLFLGAISLSVVNSASLSHSLKGILIWFEVFLVYLLVADRVPPKEIPPLILAILLAGSLEAVVGIYQFLQGEGPESFLLMGRFVRAYGTFEQPNPFGGYMGLVVPLAASVALASGYARWGVGMRSAAALALGLTAAALLMSWSRGAWVGAAAAAFALAGLGVWASAFDRRWVGVLGGGLVGGLTLYWWASVGQPGLGLWIGAMVALSGGLLLSAGLDGRRAMIWLFPLIFLAAILFVGGGLDLVPTSLAQRFIDFLPYLQCGDVRYAVLSDENYAVLERLAHWQAAWAMWANNPWLGVGIGNYVPLYPLFKIPGWDDPLGHAHNYYLQIAAETGLLGLLAYLILWSMAFWRALRLLNRAPAAWRAVVLGIIGSLVALSVHSLVDNLYVHAMNMQIGIYLGLLAVIHAATSKQGASGGALE